jgi:hypothetical protein
MNESLESMLMQEMSRRNIDMVVALLEKEPLFFHELFRIFLRNEDPVSRRAAWAIDLFSEKQPALLEPYIPELTGRLPAFTHDGMKRHSLRMISRSPLPDSNHTALLISLCFDWLVSGKEAIACKVHCMDILYKISQTEPDLKKELADTIEWRIEEESAGFKSHGTKMLRKLYKELANI